MKLEREFSVNIPGFYKSLGTAIFFRVIYKEQIRNRLTIVSSNTTRMYLPKGLKSGSHRDIRTSMFIVALSRIAKM